jgi:hypothetical protein
VIKWALKHDLGLDQKDPETITPDDAWLERRLGVFKAALSEMTIKRDGEGFALETVAINPFTDEKAPAVKHPLAPVEDGFLITGGPTKGHVIDFVQGDAADSEPFPWARLSRLAKRQ